MKESKADYFFFALDKDWHFTFVNAKASKVFNSNPSLLIGENIWDVLTENTWNGFHKAYSKALTEQQFVYLEEYYSPIGWLENYIYPSRNGLSVYGRDITEKKEIEKKLRQSQANLTATINNTETLIWSVDRDLRLMSFNKPFDRCVTKKHGTHLKEGVNIIEQVLSEETAPKLAKWNEHFNHVLFGGTVILEETLFGVDFDCSLSPIKDGNKVIGISVFCYNSTERKKNERDLMDANKQIGDLKLMALRSVMNPHFIFSTLNSIQYYIIENDQVNAVNYLTAFSKLIRGILDNSINNTIKLSQEIEMLKLYVNLELMRFDNKFDFQFETDEGIDPDLVEIPSMLIQPFVENAILHGLANKADRGMLQIRLKKVSQKILFEIDDNGIGRDAAMNIRKKNLPNHKPFAITVTKERMKLINASDDMAMEIIDKKRDGKPDGTLVRIWLKK